jgi:phage FluMu protein Com
MRKLKQLEVDKLKDSKLNYIGIIEESKKKIVFLCENHGQIEQRFDVHIKNLKCPKCKTLNNNKYTKEYINSLITIYKKPYKYFLNKDIYNVQDKISIECKEHGIFEQRLHNHFTIGDGCNKCSIENRTTITDKLNKWLLNNNISIIKYNGYKSKSIIKCNNKHIFSSTIDNLKKHGCPICNENNRLMSEREIFIENSKKYWSVELIKFEYNTLVYKGKRKLFTMNSEVGPISQLPDNHLKGYLPKKSTGESIIENILNKYSIFYEREKTFDGCINKKKLRFDFYIPSKNLCIEYNGVQHYQKVDRFGGEEKFNYQKYNDSIKVNFCEKNNINLLIISYRESVIENMKNLIMSSLS